MALLKLKLVEPTDNPVESKMFNIFDDYLHPYSVRSLVSTVEAIIDMLPEKKMPWHPASLLVPMCVELAEQIPYHHPSQHKLVRLIMRLGGSTKFWQDFSVYLTDCWGSEPF